MKDSAELVLNRFPGLYVQRSRGKKINSALDGFIFERNVGLPFFLTVIMPFHLRKCKFYHHEAYNGLYSDATQEVSFQVYLHCKAARFRDSSCEKNLA